MPTALAGAILDAVSRVWTISDDVEITLEANPSAVDRQRFEGFATAGVNRVSIGVQSFDDAALQFLGRGHTAVEADAAIRLAQQHFDRSSFDLIYALPDQTAAAWRQSLTEALQRDTGHLSLYQLTIEPGTAFHTAWVRGDLSVPAQDDAGLLYELTQDIMEGAGMPAYEISNHARAGAESRHNLTYWRYGDYVGIGPGAHGRITHNGIRHATRHHRAPEIWLERALSSADADATEKGSATVAPAEAAVEAVMMGLRTAEGVPEHRLRNISPGSDILDRDAVAILVKAGLLTDTPGILKATAAGRQRLNALLAEIIR